MVRVSKVMRTFQSCNERVKGQSITFYRRRILDEKILKSISVQSKIDRILELIATY